MVNDEDPFLHGRLLPRLLRRVEVHVSGQPLGAERCDVDLVYGLSNEGFTARLSSVSGGGKESPEPLPSQLEMHSQRPSSRWPAVRIVALFRSCPAPWLGRF